MEKTILRVNGMSCGHCVAAVTKAVETLPGVSDVVVDLNTGTVTVSYDQNQMGLDKIKSAIDDQGYDVIE